jgi:hypothetical protein
MLKNDPPPGTKVRLLQEVRKAKARETGTLVRKGNYLEERASDEFLVDVNGEQITVTRAQIEEA